MERAVPAGSVGCSARRSSFCIALLPLLNIPVLTTAGTQLRRGDGPVRRYALIAIGLNVVVGQAGLLDLGYVGFYAVGAYTVALLTSPNSPWNQTGPDGWLSTDWAWLAVLPIAMAITAISGLILGSPTLRLRGDYLAIVTLGFGEIVRLLADNLEEITGGGRGLSQVAYPRFGVTEDFPLGVFSAGNVGKTLNSGVWWYWVSIVLIIIVLLFVGNLERSQGRPGLGGYPGGRGRRRDHGRADVQVQAVGVRHRRR